MPRLPDYTALGDSPVPRGAGGVVSPNPGKHASDGGLGPALVAAGRDVAEAGAIAEQSAAHAQAEARRAAAIVERTNQRQDAMVAQAALNRLQEHRLDLEAGQGGFSGVRGAGVVGPKFLQDYQGKFGDVARDIEASLTNDNQRKLFQQRAPVVGLQFRGDLMKHQAQETDRFNAATEDRSIDLARQQIFANPLNQPALRGGLAQIDAMVDRRAERLGWTPEITAATKGVYREKVLEDVATLMVERDPVGMLMAMNRRMGMDGSSEPPSPSGIPAVDGLSPDKLAHLRARANSYVQQAQNKLQAEAEKRLREAEQEMKTAQEFALSGQMFSPAYEAQLLAKTAGTPYEQAARQTIAASYMGATHGSQTLGQQKRALQTMDATLAANGSSPEQQKLLAKAREITSTQEAAYKENPWAAATRFNHQPPVAEVQITAADQVPKLVAERLPLMTGVEVASGAAVSPLQPAEAKAWADRLKTLQPDQRAEVLAQTGAMLNLPRAAALADQLDKHDKPLALALKMGLDRTTAGRAVSALVLHGAQALQDKTVKKDDSALAGWRAEIATAVRGTLGDSQAEQDVIDAAYYVRAAQDVQGIGGPQFARGVGSGADDAIGMVIGRPLERAGVKTLMPRGVHSEDDFNERLRMVATAERMRSQIPAGEVYLRGQPVKLEQFANRVTEYGMRFAGRGRYIPVARNAPFTLDAQGRQPLVLQVVP